MRRTWRTATALGMAFGLLVVAQAFAQEREGQDIGKQLERKAAGQQKVCLASKVHGMTVKDKANQNIGQIQDLVIDQSGQVQYLAIASQEGAADRATDRAADRSQPGRTATQPGRTATQPGAKAGADPNQKLTLVPFEAAQFHEGETAAQAYVSLNLDKDRITQAPSFTRTQLTAQGQEAQWMSRVDQFFGQQKGESARPDLNKTEEKKERE